MSYNRTTTVNAAPGGDSVKTGVLNLDTDLTAAFAALNDHAEATTTHGITGNFASTTATQTLTNKSLTAPIITDGVYAITDAPGFAIDPTLGAIQTITLGASRTPVAANFAAGMAVTLMILDGTAYTITWSSVPVTWIGSTAPTLSLTGYTVVQLWKVGTTIYGLTLGYT